MTELSFPAAWKSPELTLDEAPVKTNAQRIDDVIDMLDLGCPEEARVSAEVLRGEIRTPDPQVQ